MEVIKPRNYDVWGYDFNEKPMAIIIRAHSEKTARRKAIEEHGMWGIHCVFDKGEAEV